MAIDDITFDLKSAVLHERAPAGAGAVAGLSYDGLDFTYAIGGSGAVYPIIGQSMIIRSEGRG